MENKFHGQGKYIWEHGAYYIGAWYSPAPYVCIHMCVLVLAVMLLMCNWLNYMRISMHRLTVGVPQPTVSIVAPALYFSIGS